MRIATFDIESYDWINADMVGFYDGENYLTWEGEECISQFMNYLIKSKAYRVYKIFAHFGCRFDFLFICDYMQRNNILDRNRMVISSGDILKIEFLDEGHNKPILTFVDSGRLLLKSLEDLTKSFDVEHKKLDMDRANMENMPIEEKRKYLYHDVLGLYEVLEIFNENVKKLINITPKLTIASTSMYGFKNYLKERKMFFNVLKDYSVDNYIRKSFYGGRVEIFNMYGKNIYAYDVTSMYPYVMREGIMPFGKYVKMEEGKDYTKLLKKYRGYAKFRIHTPNIDIPVLPYRDNKLIFPIGDFEGWYSTTEIEYAKELGYEVEFLGGYFARFKEDLFKEYIDILYNARKKAIEEGDEVKALILKILMNSLFGKFGENWYKTKLLYNLDDIDIGNDEIEIVLEDPPIYLKHEIIGRPYYNVGISAEITTLSRIRLHQIIKSITDLGYKIYYVDTDCIHTNCPPDRVPNGYLNPTKLGYLKQEYLKYGGKIKEGLYLAPKFYFLKMENGQVIKKHKGFRNITLKFDDLVAMYFDKTVKIRGKDSSIMKLKESIKANKDTPKRKLTDKGLFLKKKEIIKDFKSMYDKRIIIGRTTKPILIHRIDEDIGDE